MKKLSCAFILFLLVACGGDSATVVTPVPPANVNQVNPVSRDQLQTGGKFTWAVEHLPITFNYYHLDGGDKVVEWIVSALLPTAYSTDASGTPVWNKDLFASEPVLVAEPKQVVTYRINPRAVWYDGTPITWEDFHWQWRATNGANKSYQIASATGWANIESVERGADDKEVVVTFRERYADWPGLFGPLYPASSNKDPKIFNTGWVAEPLTSAGPFRLARIDQTSLTITLVRNEKWWGTASILDTIVYREMKLEAQIDALDNKEIDAMDIGPDAARFARASGMAHIEVRAAAGPNFRHITLNGTSNILSDKQVRKALAVGIDRAAIAKALLTPLGREPVTLENHVFMTNHAGYKRNSGDAGTPNPDKAGALLDSAGWKMDGDVRKKDGRPLAVTIHIPNEGGVVARQEAELIQAMLKPLGFNADISAVPANTFFPRNVIGGEYDIAIFSWMGSAYPISSAVSIYSLPGKAADGTLDVRQNYARVGSPEIDSLFAEAAKELDRTRAIELANRADSLVFEIVHSLPMYQRPEIIATNKQLANFGAFGYQQPWKYQDIGWIK